VVFRRRGRRNSEQADRIGPREKRDREGRQRGKRRRRRIRVRKEQPREDEDGGVA
jgi:hypothetical protein